MTKNQVHEWHESLPENGKRYYRAHWDSRQWRISTTLKEEPEWYVLEKPGLDVWEALREVLFNKYQRKRLPFRLLQNVDAILAELRGEIMPPA